MRRVRFVIAGLLAVLLTGLAPGSPPASASEALAPLRISDDGHDLVLDDGRPFTYLADTAWELFHRLDRQEAEQYLSDRAGKGFTAIQAVGLAEFEGLTEPNAYGDLPFMDGDPSRPNEAYWEHVDYIIRQTEALGMRMALLPTWGRWVTGGYQGGPRIFTEENAEVYGRFLGERYSDHQVIWVIGGDTSPVWRGGDYTEIYRAMARGINLGVSGAEDYDATLMTYHPAGGTSSSFHWPDDEPWLDFHMFHSGHRPSRRPYGIDNHVLAALDRALVPAKPTIDGEPRYDDHPIDSNSVNGYFTDYDARQAAYWSLFAGATGHTYGNHSIWQFYDPARQAPVNDPLFTWQEAIARPAAAQMGHVRALIESRDPLSREPAQELLVSPEGEGQDFVAAARAEDGAYGLVYLPHGAPVTVDLDQLSGERVRAWWFDPRTGRSRPSRVRPGQDIATFTPPSTGPQQDWVLVLDDLSRRFSPPGRSRPSVSS